MRLASISGVSIAAATAFLLSATPVLADDSKTISDGAAKGQATERTITEPGRQDRDPKTYNSSHSNTGNVTAPQSTGGKPGLNDSRNISDGAAKGQASE